MEISQQRKKVVVLAGSVASMSSTVALLAQKHGKLAAAWAVLMAVGLVFTIAEFAKLKRQEP